MKEAYSFSFEVYEHVDELNDADASLIKKARAAAEQAYAPYSKFLWVQQL